MKPNYLVKTRRQAIARARRKYGLKDYEGALAEWDELMSRNPEDSLPWLGRFDCLMKLDRKQEMLAIGDKVCALFPESEAAHNNFACLLLEQRDFDGACRHFDVALALAPERTMYYFNAGLAYRGAGQLNQAAVCFERVLEEEPNHERALEFLSQLYLQFGATERAVALSMRLRMLRPGYTLPLQRRLHVMINDASIGEAELNLELSLLRTALSPTQTSEVTKPDEPVRIGWILCPWSLPFLRYVMPTFKQVRDPAQVQLVAFCNQPQLEIESVESDFDAVHRISEGTAAALAESFRSNPVDVLVDTAGQVPNNLLQHFARRLAPLQVSWPFFHCQLEMILMDHALVDKSMMPDAAQSAASNNEKGQVSLVDRLVSLGDSQYFYDLSDADLPKPDLLPSSKNEFITFGVVADLAQINQTAVDAWAQILKKVPHSRLAFHHTLFPAAIAERQLTERCREAGLSVSRIDFVPRSGTMSGRYEAFSEIDVLLSPWPVTDDMALLDAMVSGVPVVTLIQGLRGSSRAKCILEAAGQSRFAHTDLADYCAAAVSLARDEAGRRALRDSMRDDISQQPFCDAASAARNWLGVVRNLIPV